MSFLVGSEVALYSPSQDDDGNGTSTLTALVGSNDGAITGATWVEDEDNGGKRALELSSDYVTVANSSDFAFGTDPWWFSVWFKLTSTTPIQMILDKGYNTGGPTRFYFMLLNSTTFRIWTGDVSTSLEFSVPGGYVNKWINTIFNRYGSIVGAWVNGTIAATYGSLSLSRNFTNADIFSIGDRSDQTGAFPMTGRIDPVRFGTGVLTAEDIAILSSRRVPGTPLESSLHHHAEAGYQ